MGTFPMRFVEVPAKKWVEQLGQPDVAALLPAVIETIRILLIPLWEAARPSDRRPHRALEAAEGLVLKRSDNARLHALAVAKACTKARTETLGYDHLIVEACRAVVWTVTRPSAAARLEALGEAIAAIEEHLVYRDQVAGIYDTEPEKRAMIIDCLNRRLA